MKHVHHSSHKTYIYLYEAAEFRYWANRWGVTIPQLNEAILETGSVNIVVLRAYFIEKGMLFSFESLMEFSKKTIKDFFGEVTKRIVPKQNYKRADNERNGIFNVIKR